MNTEEFTFPIITASNNVVHLSTVLPPLWRIPSINSGADSDQPNGGNGRRITKILTANFSSQTQGEISNYNSAGDVCNNLNNNNSAEEDRNVVDSVRSEEDAELEKMDVLWEDFNEDLMLQSSSTSSSISELHHHHHHNNNIVYGEQFDQENGEGYCNELEEKSRKRKNLELVFKMLKKVFLLQNMPTIKKAGPYS